VPALGVTDVVAVDPPPWPCVAEGVLSSVDVAPDTATTMYADEAADPIVYETVVSEPVATSVHTYAPRKSCPVLCSVQPVDSGRFDPDVVR
jgi:hypothetical protein